MERFGERFDHNLHALRIVETFEQRYARFPGLNLSFEVREGIVKHSHDFEAGESAQLDAYLPGVRPPLEAQLIDPADEVAYNTADLDDAWSAGLITAGDVAEAVPQYREIHEAVETQFPGATERERFHEALRQLIDLLVSGLIEGTVTAAQASGAAGYEEVRAYPLRLARFTAEAGETSRALKRFLYTRVYASDALGSDRRLSMARIAELFRFFLASPDRLPQPYAQQALDGPAHGVVCDYIAGMTDAFLHRTYELMLCPAANPRLS
jgi:dGTPase